MALTTKTIKPPFEFVTSWDDGWHLDKRIKALLIKYQVQGTFYVVVDWVDTDGYLTWDEIKEFDKQGFKIGSHTMSHPADLKVLHDADLHYELQTSKDLIESALGHSISSLCYPRGRTNERVKDYVAQAGYVEARITGPVGVSEVKDKLEMPATLHVLNERYEEDYKCDFKTYAIQKIKEVKGRGGYVNLWGHSKEIDEHGLWDDLEEVLKTV